MSHQLVGLLERALVEQKFNALSRRHLAFFMLPFAALLASALFRQAVALLQFVNLLLELHSEPL